MDAARSISINSPTALTPETTLVSDHVRKQRDRNAPAAARNRRALPGARRRFSQRCHSVIWQRSLSPHGVCDALSLAAHKFHGPKGAGLLYLRAGLPVERLQFGGSHENQRRPGTENVAAIAGMAKAAELALASMDAERPRQASLRDRLWEGVREAFPAAIMNGDPEARLANTLNVSFPGLDGESLLINLDLAGICASSGSACMVGSILPVACLDGDGRLPGAGAGHGAVFLGPGNDRGRDRNRDLPAAGNLCAARFF